MREVIKEGGEKSKVKRMIAAVIRDARPVLAPA